MKLAPWDKSAPHVARGRLVALALISLGLWVGVVWAVLALAGAP